MQARLGDASRLPAPANPESGIAVRLLIATIAGAGFIGLLVSDWSFDLGAALLDPVVWLLVAAFALTETFGIDLPFRRQRHTYSLSEIPTILGLFYLSPDALLLSCLLGSVIAYVIVRRQSAVKVAFNVSLQFAVLILQILVFEAIASTREPTEATAIVGAYVAVLLSAVVSHSAVSYVITLVTRATSMPLFWRGLVLGIASQLANASLGLAAVVLVDVDWRAIFILLTPIVVMFAAYRSLGKRVEAEEKARISEARFASLIRSSSDVTTLLDAEGTLQYVSDAARHVLGVDPRAVVGRHVRDLFDAPSETLDEFVAAVEEAIVAKDPVMLDVTSVDAEGDELQLEVHVVNLLTDQDVDAVLMTVRDVTDRRRLEERLVQAQKMDAIGQLAGGVAHDFNNLLAVIQNYAAFVKDDLPADSPSGHDIEEILKATGTASSLTRQLLSFARREFMQSSIIDVNELVRSTSRMLSRTIEASIELETVLSEDLPNVKIDPVRLEQVLMNLAVNAKDAMPDGGRLVFRTYESHIAASLTKELDAGRYIVISVEDTGVGIDPAAQARIFEPFFTTKPKGSGTGLGLSTAYGIVKQFGGHLEVDSRVGDGTMFQIYLPATTESVTKSEDLEPVPAFVPACTVLVAEDSAPLRRMVHRVLSNNAYEVIVAESGAEAFELWQQRSRDIDLLVTDVVMPKMSGKELSDMTGLPTVYMSGYTDQILSHDQLAEGTVFLQKPFSASELLASITRVLEGNTTTDPARSDPT